MTVTDFFIGIIAAGIVTIAFFLVPALIQLRKTARKAEASLEAMNKDLQPLLSTLVETSNELQNLARVGQEQIKKTEKAIANINSVSMRMKNTGDVLWGLLVPLLVKTGGISAGIRAFTRALSRDGGKAVSYTHLTLPTKRIV